VSPAPPQLYVHPPSCHLLPTILMLPGPVLCALPKWRSSDRVRLLSSVCMFQVHPKCSAFGRQALLLSILPCISFQWRSEELRAVPCEFLFHHFVVLLISVWQDDAGAPLTLTGVHSQREFMPVCSLDSLLIITIKVMASLPCLSINTFTHIYIKTSNISSFHSTSPPLIVQTIMSEK
jgi:hypothetical protein